MHELLGHGGSTDIGAWQKAVAMAANALTEEEAQIWKGRWEAERYALPSVEEQAKYVL